MGRRSQEKPGRATMGQDEPKRRGEARQSQGSHSEFCRVPLGLGARGWAGGAKRSQGGPKMARMIQRREGEARQSHEEPGEP